MKFTKMHGIGNDYIYINLFEEKVENPAELSILLSDRRKGVGGDGIILIGPSKNADFYMHMYNLDGSEGKMCGNGVRCVGKYVYDKGLTQKDIITVETLSGIKTLKLNVSGGKVDTVRVNMGAPILKSCEIPVNSTLEEFINQPIEVEGTIYHLTCLSMGNPHAVVYVEDVSALNLEQIGPKFEHYHLFPDRINTEFVQVLDSEHLKMRVWERGSGETMACGTGACAVLVASVLNGKAKRTAEVQLLGGNLEIEWNEADNKVYMTGSATTVFEGELV
ncbi:MAG: diaminopimelate epimerase [Oscillospiraceae bacterium]|jgi:diaminopimelate epimerase|nr:diaminopimelate epimerase [Oscillospiraceae bacterium]